MLLMIEVTRRCNLLCAHCMRGDAQDCSFQKWDLLEELIKRVSPSEIFISGGEPLLNPEGIKKVVEMAPISCEISVISNGTLPLTKERLEALHALREHALVIARRRWERWKGNCPGVIETYKTFQNFWAETSEGVVLISNDEYHPSVVKPEYKGWARLKRRATTVYAIGRGKGLPQADADAAAKVLADAQQTPDKTGVIYITAKGDVVSHCDLSYEWMDHNKNIWRVTLEEYLESLS